MKFWTLSGRVPIRGPAPPAVSPRPELLRTSMQRVTRPPLLRGRRCSGGAGRREGGISCYRVALMLPFPGSSAPPSDLGGRSSTKGSSQIGRLVGRLPFDPGVKVVFILTTKCPLWRLRLQPLPPGPHRCPTRVQKTTAPFSGS